MIKIGALARETGTPVATIRYYESAGLLPAAARTGANYRLYGTAHVERLSFIRNCRSLDMTLDEVGTLLRFKDTPESDCAEVGALLDAHLGHVADRIRTLRQLETQLKSLREVCRDAETAGNCQILVQLSQATAPTTPAQGTTARRASARGHVHGTHAPHDATSKKPLKAQQAAADPKGSGAARTAYGGTTTFPVAQRTVRQ